MKKLVLTLVAGAFGSLLVLPMAHAQDYQDMGNDANQIHEDQRDIHHDEHEMRHDLKDGNFGAAAHEDKEIEERKANEDEEKQDLSNDLSEQRHHDHDYDD